MLEKSKPISWKNAQGDPVYSDNLKITPESQSLIFNLPYFHFSWSRPVAVYVSDGQIEERVQILDMTRLIQLGIVAAGLISAAAIWVVTRGQR